MAIKLNDEIVRGLKTTLPQQDVADAEVRGLKLRITRHGTKTWAFKYRSPMTEKAQTVTLGHYPSIDVKKARVLAREEKGKIDAGHDPAGAKQASRSAMTFRELAELRFERDADLTDSTRTQYEFSFAKHVYPAFGHEAANMVTAEMIASVMDDIEERAPAMADRTRAAIGSTFKWAMGRKRGGVKVNPTVGLARRAKSRPRTRVPADNELGRFWATISKEATPITDGMRLIFKLAVITGQRRAEIAGARVSELDLVNKKWLIPGDKNVQGKLVRGRMKNGKDHTVYLSDQAVALFEAALAINNDSDVVFPSNKPRTKGRAKQQQPHLLPDSVTQSMVMMRKLAGIEDFTTHDLRRAITTWLDNKGHRPDVLDEILSHKKQGVTGRHYAHGAPVDLVVAAMQAWADHVWHITGQAAASDTTNVLPLRQLSR